MPNDTSVSLQADVNTSGSGVAAPETKGASVGKPLADVLPFTRPNAEDYFVYNTDEDGYYYWHGNHWAGIDKATAYDNLQHGFGKVDSQNDQAASRFLYQVRSTKQVRLAVKLAGYSAGVHRDTRNNPFLVIESTESMAGTPGEWPLIKRIITNMLREQTKYFHSWMKCGLKALRDKTGAPGHYLVIMGNHNTGKTLLQEKIISPLLDCLPTKCVEYLTGKTEFNSDLFGSFHLMVSDGLVLNNYQEKQVYTERVKELVANTVKRLRGMYKNAVHVPYNCRLSCSLNLPAINSLPLIEDGMRDKMLLLKASPHRYIVGSDYSRPRYEAQIAAELPHYAHWLLNEWQILESLKKNITDERFGFAAYLNPQILEHRAEESREASLAGMLRSFVAGENADYWKSTPGDLFDALSQKFKKRFDQLCANPQVLGQLAKNLEKNPMPGVRIKKSKSSGDRVIEVWIDREIGESDLSKVATPALDRIKKRLHKSTL